jgi:hypothetical protein
MPVSFTYMNVKHSTNSLLRHVHHVTVHLVLETSMASLINRRGRIPHVLNKKQNVRTKCFNPIEHVLGETWSGGFKVRWFGNSTWLPFLFFKTSNLVSESRVRYWLLVTSFRIFIKTALCMTSSISEYEITKIWVQRHNFLSVTLLKHISREVQSSPCFYESSSSQQN